MPGELTFAVVRRRVAESPSPGTGDLEAMRFLLGG